MSQDHKNTDARDLGIRCRGCGGNIPGKTTAAGPSYHYECIPKPPDPLCVYRRVVEMWAHYRFCCSDTPSPAKLDRMLAECDEATTAALDLYGFTHKESELFKP